MRPSPPDDPGPGRARSRLLGPLALLAGVAPAAEAQVGPALRDYRAATLAASGDPDRGRRLFEDVARTRCAGCHAVGVAGPSIGPDLSGLGGGRATPGEILDSILEPSARVHPDYAATTVALASGRTLGGILRPISDDEAEIIVSAAETVRFRRSEVEEQAPSQTSIMPAGLHQALSPAEMADLIAYLGALEPPASASAREAVNARDIPRATRPVEFRPVALRQGPLDNPVWLGPVPGRPGVVAVVEMRRGRVWTLDLASGDRELFADLGGDTTPGELTGLTAVAFHPDFDANGRYFVKLHTPRSAGPLAVQVVERRATPDRRRDSGEPARLLLKIPVVSDIHNGGHLAFGPDRMLYVAMGDTGPQGDPRGHGQDLSTLLGKVNRIDVARAEGDRPYAIPADNPFRATPGARPEIWAYGFREPWRFSFDTPTGDLWVGDVGQGLYEEVTIARAGENHGWNVLEGFRPFSDRFARPGSRYVPPVFAYHHRVGVSVTGGFVYRGTKNPALVGKYIFGDYETRRVWALEQRDRQLASIVEIGRTPGRIASFGVDDAGEIYVVALDQGALLRIDAAGADLTPAPVLREVAPTARARPVAWRHVEDEPAEGWMSPDFDDSAWPEAPGGFGTRGTPGSVVRTEWPTRDIWLRRGFDLTEAPRYPLRLSIHHDEDAEVYLNGVLAARLPGFTADYDEMPVAAEAVAALRPGRNTLAIHCHQTGGGQYIDAGIVELAPPPIPK